MDRTNELMPAISPDGRRVAYVTDKRGNADVWVMDLLGREARPLVENPATDGPGDWSQDGSRYYFLSDRDGSVAVWMVTAAGASPVRVLLPPAPLSLPDLQSYGKFALSARQLIVPLETRESSVYVLDGLGAQAERR
jgi:Tol biopolymer transport system component